MNTQGTIYIISAPSGAGKHTILRRVMQDVDGLEYSISATTRPPREGEVDGVDYHFLGREEFCQRIETGAFVEWAEVHGNLYGTLREELDRRIGSGKDVILELDVQGMRNTKAQFPSAVTVFIMPPSPEVLEQRLRARGTDAEAVIRVRMRNAAGEMAARGEYDYVIVNDQLDEAVNKMNSIIRAHRARPVSSGPATAWRCGESDERDPNATLFH